MKKRILTRRDFLKLAGLGTAVIVPSALGYGVFRSAQGEYPVEGSPYVENPHTKDLDGSVPVLLVVNKVSGNPFGVYLGEILRAEGLNCFHTVDLSDIQGGSLEKYDIVILAETPLNTVQAEIFEGYVARGGRLVSMKPDDRLGSVFGLEKIEGNIVEGYIKTDSNHQAGNGINPSTLQFHGIANLYRSVGAEVVVWLYHDREMASGYPAVTVNQYGEGLAGLWAFDLARSIAYTRQGNPEWSNEERDGLDGIRTIDLFKDWIDLERMIIPQADEHQRLLVNLLDFLSQRKRPLPRVWYFPNGANGIHIATGDSHFDSGQIIDKVLALVEQYGGHMSIYYEPDLVSTFGRTERRVRFWVTDNMPVVGDFLRKKYISPTPDEVSDWRRRGHEFTLHPNVDWGLESGWTQHWQEFTGRGYGPISSTVRTHRVLWTGWVESARLQASYGIRMDVDFYQIGPSLQTAEGVWKYGHVTGSGRPMKFVDEEGRILNVYQQLTQLADEHLIDWKELGTYGFQGWPKLSPEGAAEVYKDMLDRSIRGEFTPITFQYHVDPFENGGIPADKAAIFMERTLSIAKSNNIPIWSAQDWLRFTDARCNTKFSKIYWEEVNSVFIFEINGGIERGIEIDVLMPTYHNGRELYEVFVNANPVNFQRKTVGNISYAMISILPGLNRYSGYYK